MKDEIYACVHVADFPAQAIVRLRPELKGKPVLVVQGQAPQESVCSFNHLANRRGATLGMTPLDAQSIPGAVLPARSAQCEIAARSVVLECAATFSPRIEEVSYGTVCGFVLDITGTERLFGPPVQLAERLRASLADAGFHASLAISTNFDTARLKARTIRGIAVIPPGEESAALANLAIAEMRLGEEPLETFALWGIRTLGALANLPRNELVTRFGQTASRWREIARGTAAHTFQPIEPAFTLEEFCAFETPVEQIDSLLFIAAHMMDCLASRAASRALSLASVTALMKLDSCQTHPIRIRPALPTIDRKFLLKLLHLEIGAHPPPAAVTALTLTAEAGQSSKVQLGLFAPQTPEPSRLDVTLARLKAIVGEERVGSPVLDDTQRPGSFHMGSFSLAVPTAEPKQARMRIALRRMRPPVPVRVAMRNQKPATFRSIESSFDVIDAYGPWKTAGCWWSTDEWNLEEWDVLAADSTGKSVACLLVHDCTQKEWRLEAHYD